MSEGSQTSNAAVIVRQLAELEKDVVLNSFKERGADDGADRPIRQTELPAQALSYLENNA